MEEQNVIFEVVPSKQNSRWNEIVHSFPHWDIYYLNEYAHSFEIHGDGEAFLIYFQYTDNVSEDESAWKGMKCVSDNKVTVKEINSVLENYGMRKWGGCRLCYVVMKKDISADEKFSGILSEDVWYDLETPYGYGGLLLQGTFAERVREAFERKLTAYVKEHRIVSQFVRLHPVYRNDVLYAQMTGSKVCYLRDTIYMDTTNKEKIMANMDSKNRNMVRKAVKNNVTICHDKGEHLDEFIRIYEATMTHDHAACYYYFEREYYEYLIEHMKDHMEFFYSIYEGKYIGAAIFFYNQEYMHYHLSGMDVRYRFTAATNLLLYEAAVWACDKGIRVLHLGGGMEAEDSLFGFKKQFNKQGRLPFHVGRTIFDQDAYGELVRLRKEADEAFDMDNNFMIQYRK